MLVLVSLCGFSGEGSSEYIMCVWVLVCVVFRLVVVYRLFEVLVSSLCMELLGSDEGCVVLCMMCCIVGLFVW